jgi:hypothetical protein
LARRAPQSVLKFSLCRGIACDAFQIAAHLMKTAR